MKRLFALFTMLLCFSIAGICKTTITDLSENSKVNTELVSYSDVVKLEVAQAASFGKSIVSDLLALEVPIFKSEPIVIINTSDLISPTLHSSGIAICIRDKIRNT